MDRYTVISADCHGGGAIAGYRAVPAGRAGTTTSTRGRRAFENPYDDLEGADASRNWDSDRRLAELEADGVVAEVIFPNTIPPFFPKGSLVHQPPAAIGRRPRAALGRAPRAHNRWLADFCAAAPGRRAGIAQILLHDVDAAVDEIRWAQRGRAHRRRAAARARRPGSGLAPLYAPDYEPLWQVCEELGLPVNHHTGQRGRPTTATTRKPR